MKNYIAALFLVLGIFTTHAQHKTRLGLKGGLNISTVTVSGVNVDGDICTKAGFHIGGFMAVPIAEKWEIHPEILYSNQGYKYDFEEFNAKFKTTTNINYLALPFMVCYYPVKKFDIEVGPQISFLLSNKSELDYTIFNDDGSTEKGTVSVDQTDESQSIEFGMNIGASYKLTTNFFVSARYNFGISTINKKFENGPNEDEKDRNSVFQFSLGYLFN